MNDLGRIPSRWFWVAVMILTAVPAWADGELDTTFGTNGVVKIAFPDAPTAYLRDVAVVNGVIEAAGFNAIPGCAARNSVLIVQLSPNGSIIGTPVSQPLSVTCGRRFFEIVSQPTLTLSIDPTTGNVFVIGDGVIQQFDSSGRQLWTRDPVGPCV